MVQVQIASQLTFHGVAGLRWVLVEVDDTARLTAPAAAGALAGAPPAWVAVTTAQRSPRALSLALLKLLVAGLGIGAALWLAQAMLGPTHTLPGAAPAAPPASAAEPLVTAEVS